MLTLTPEDEILFATWWDALGIRVADIGFDRIKLYDMQSVNQDLAILPRTLYSFLTINLIDLYENWEPAEIRESILQEGRLH